MANSCKLLNPLCSNGSKWYEVFVFIYFQKIWFCASPTASLSLFSPSLPVYECCWGELPSLFFGSSPTVFFIFSLLQFVSFVLFLLSLFMGILFLLCECFGFPYGFSILMILQMTKMFKFILNGGIIHSSNCSTFCAGLPREQCLNIDSLRVRSKVTDR